MIIIRKTMMLRVIIKMIDSYYMLTKLQAMFSRYTCTNLIFEIAPEVNIIKFYIILNFAFYITHGNLRHKE